MAAEIDFEGEGWTKKVESSKPNVSTDAAVLEVRELKEQVRSLRTLVLSIGKGEGADNGSSA